MGLGIAGLMRGAGAGAGLQDLIKQRLMERQMALQEQAQREDTAYRNRALDVNSEALAAQREFQNQLALSNLAERRQAGLEKFAANDVGSTAVGSSISPERADVWSQGGQGGVIRNALTGTVSDPEAGGERPAMSLFRGFTPQESDKVEARQETLAAREASARDSADLRRELQSNQLGFMAAQSAESRAFQERMAREKASTPQVKPPTGTQRAAVKYFDRMKEAITDFATVSGNMAKQGMVGQLQTIGPNITQSSEQRRYNNALARFTEARLRKDSGAAVPPEEYRKDLEVYGIRPGDDADTIKQKQRAMLSTAMALAIEAGNNAMTEQYGEGWRDILGNIVGGGADEAPPAVVEALGAKGPGRYKLSDGTSWIKNADGSITGVK